jgi:hypothetical protein
MKKSVVENRNLILKYKIPHEYATDEAVYIKTRNALYELDLNTFANNPYVFRVINITKKTSKLVSKDTFLRLMCDYFKLPFEHWDDKIKQKELSATKEVPKSIVIGGLYTTTWAKPFAIWKLKDIIGETDVILSSPKTGVEITSKLSDLRLWTNLPK